MINLSVTVMNNTTTEVQKMFSTEVIQHNYEIYLSSLFGLRCRRRFGMSYIYQIEDTLV